MKYVILGNYGATNIGDEAILASIIDSLREKDNQAEITVMSYDPESTSLMHEIDSVIQFPAGLRSIIKAFWQKEIFKTIKALKKCDRVIFGGGGLFVEDKFRAVLLWFWQIFWASRFCKKITFYRQTVGKLQTKIARFLTKKACSYCEEIVVRDKESKNLLEYLGIKNISIAPDPVLEWKFFKKIVSSCYDRAYEEVELGEEKTTNSYIIVSLRPWHVRSKNFVFEIAKDLSDFCKKNNYEVFFVPFQTKIEDDRSLFEELKKNIKSDVKMHLYEFDYQKVFKEEMQKLIELMVFAEKSISMRLHALIFSYLCKLDTVGIVYSNKVQSFVDFAQFKSVNTRNVDKLSSIL